MSKLKQIFSNPDLKKRILITIGLLIIFRILSHIPIPGVSLEELRSFFNQNQLFGLLNLFTGGAMKNFSIVMMGVGPYITASIIFQLLTIVVPSLEQLNKEGEYGRKKINYYTRIATVPLAILNAYGMIAILKGQGIAIEFSTYELILTITTMTAGTILLMWIGELISESGIGNGISLIISLGIIANVPTSIFQTLSITETDPSQIVGLVLVLIFAILVIVGIIYINEGERRVPVTYARRVRGNKTYSGVDTHLPIRVNIAGVIPIIFALSIMVFPEIIAKIFSQAKSEFIVNTANWIQHLFQNQLFYGIFYFVLVIAFTFFYTSVVFQPTQIAKNLQRQGGFIPGLRPGKETSDYLQSIVIKIAFIGAMFLAIIAVLPFVVQAATGITTLVIGGTGILIVVSVIIDTMKQIDSHLVTHSYDNY